MGQRAKPQEISIHAPTRGATWTSDWNWKQDMSFQSTLPREERRCVTDSMCRHSIFQSTLPREERPTAVDTVGALRKFQSTLPREERLLQATPFTLGRHYFNPRSHERSDYACSKCGVISSISIHAPTRGATAGYLQCNSYRNVFQSTLPREERRERKFKSFNMQRDFNPRSHERSDKCPFLPLKLIARISIHAPTRGATAILHKKFVYFYTIPTINI